MLEHRRQQHAGPLGRRDQPKPRPLPIYPAHILKTRRAVARELAHVGADTRAAMLAALNRFTHSPIRQRSARRNVHQALALLGD